MNARQLKIFELTLIVSVAFLPSIIKSVFFVFTSSQAANYSGLQCSDYVIWLIQAMLAIVLMFYILHINNRGFNDIGLSLKFNWSNLVTGIVLMIIAEFTNSLIAEFVNIVSPDLIEKANSPQNAVFLETDNWSMLFLIMIIIPLEEELIVRGFTMSEVYKLTGNKILAVAVSVLIQISYHLYQGLTPIMFLLPYFIIAPVYFIETGNLNPLIYSHIMIDLLNLFWRR